MNMWICVHYMNIKEYKIWYLYCLRSRNMKCLFSWLRKKGRNEISTSKYSSEKKKKNKTKYIEHNDRTKSILMLLHHTDTQNDWHCFIIIEWRIFDENEKRNETKRNPFTLIKVHSMRSNSVNDTIRFYL